MINSEFANWLTSFSGVDGGNIRGAIWFCGIEYGGSEDLDNLAPILQSPSIDRETREEWLTYRYNQKIMKLYSGLLGRDVAEYAMVASELDAFSSTSQVFKMNLYPVPFRNTANSCWTAEHYRRTGIPTKEQYRVYCQGDRFSLIQNWVQKSHDTLRLIICTGLDYCSDFILAFGGAEVLFSSPVEVILDSKRYVYTMINDRKTLLAIVPFVGHQKYALNSNESVQDFTTSIRELCNKELGPSWL